MSVVAAFDVDGTLTTRDCVVPFLELVAGRARLGAGILRHPLASSMALVRRDRDRFKALAVRSALEGRDAGAVAAVGETFAAKVFAEWMRADTCARLSWHRQQGHRVVLVSASLGSYLHALGARLGVDGVVCTEAAVGGDGRFTGELIGANCRGAEKVRRLRAWLATENLGEAEVWAYGDSAGDRELLSSAHHHLFVKDREVSAVPDSSS